jgi:hypothetical protein
MRNPTAKGSIASTARISPSDLDEKEGIVGTLTSVTPAGTESFTGFLFSQSVFTHSGSQAPSTPGRKSSSFLELIRRQLAFYPLFANLFCNRK